MSYQQRAIAVRHCIFMLVPVLMLASVSPVGATDNTQSAQLSQTLPVRGVVRPAAQATITTDLAARVLKIGYKEGERFRAGDLLVAFDCDRHLAELASAEAQMREMQVAYKSAALLERHKAGARQDVETTRARMERTTADANAIRIRLRQCRIVAPYDGSVQELAIHEHEMPAAGKPLLTIVSSREPEIELIVPSTWLKWLAPGTEFDFLVEETRQSYRGVISRLGASVDTVSQTLKVFARFATPTPNVLPGNSGTAQFRGHKS